MSSTTNSTPPPTSPHQWMIPFWSTKKRRHLDKNDDKDDNVNVFASPGSHYMKRRGNEPPTSTPSTFASSSSATISTGSEAYDDLIRLLDMDAHYADPDTSRHLQPKKVHYHGYPTPKPRAPTPRRHRRRDEPLRIDSSMKTRADDPSTTSHIQQRQKLREPPLPPKRSSFSSAVYPAGVAMVMDRDVLRHRARQSRCCWGDKVLSKESTSPTGTTISSCNSTTLDTSRSASKSQPSPFWRGGNEPQLALLEGRDDTNEERQINVEGRITQPSITIDVDKVTSPDLPLEYKVQWRNGLTYHPM